MEGVLFEHMKQSAVVWGWMLTDKKKQDLEIGRGGPFCHNSLNIKERFPAWMILYALCLKKTENIFLEIKILFCMVSPPDDVIRTNGVHWHVFHRSLSIYLSIVST